MMPMAEDDAGDRLSLLPDCLLETIVSLLPPKSAARTMMLSRRWRSIWPSHPLRLDLDDDLGSRLLLDDRAISSILASHNGPIHRFCIVTTTPKTIFTSPPSWLGALARKTYITDLALKFNRNLLRFQPVLPGNLLAASAGVALRRLELHYCHIGFFSSDLLAPSFPCLEYLKLANVEILVTALHRMLDGCTALRELDISMVHGLRRVSLRSRTLVTASIGSPDARLDELCVRDTPCLQTITFSYINLWQIPDFTVDVVSAPRLQEIGLVLPMASSPSLRATLRRAKRLPMVTSLVLSMEFESAQELKEAAHILTLFPRLKRLQIWCLNFGSRKYQGFYRGWPLEAGSAIATCLNQLQLTHVVLRGYCATRGELEFARFLVSLAWPISSMAMIHSANWSAKEIEVQREEICKRGGASSTAAQLLRFTKSDTIEARRKKMAAKMNQVEPLV